MACSSCQGGGHIVELTPLTRQLFPTVGHYQVGQTVTYRYRTGQTGGGRIAKIRLEYGLETVDVRDGVSNAVVPVQIARGDTLQLA
jgi:hypothetical protein